MKANCKICKVKFEQKKFNVRYCLQTDECIEAYVKWQKTEREKANKRKWQTEKKELKEGLLTKKDYLNILQKIFNTYIRKRDEGKPCVSCDKFLKPNDVNASHFFSVGSYPNLRFNEFNVHSSCIECNMHKGGNLIEYDLRLPNRIGIENYNKLKEDRNKPLNLTIAEVKELIKVYRDKVKQLKKEL